MSSKYTDVRLVTLSFKNSMIFIITSSKQKKIVFLITVISISFHIKSVNVPLQIILRIKYIIPIMADVSNTWEVFWAQCGKRH